MPKPASSKKLLPIIAGLAIAAVLVLIAVVELNKPEPLECPIHPDPGNQCLDNTYTPN